MAGETEALAADSDSQGTEMPGPPLSKCSREKVKVSNSARVAGQPSSVAVQSGPSTVHMKAEGQTKWPKPKIDLRALFDYHFTRKQHRFRKKWNLRERKTNTSRKRAKERTERQRIPKDERRRRIKERGIVFPFVAKYYGRKHLPFKMVRSYEQAALKGFLKYIETLKYEQHLKKSLTQLNAGDDLEKECLESRKHKYLDDDGPISPIAETNEDGDEDMGARVVDNSCFILSSKIPEKKKKLKRKEKQSN